MGYIVKKLRRTVCMIYYINVTLHHEMSRNVPDGHFHAVLIFSESKFYAIYNCENHF